MNKKSRSSVEMNNKSFRSAMISGDVDPLIYVTCVVLLEKSSQMFTIYGQRADTDDGGLEGFLYKAIHVCIYKELYEKSSFMVIPPERQIERRN